MPGSTIVSILQPALVVQIFSKILLTIVELVDSGPWTRAIDH